MLFVLIIAIFIAFSYERPDDAWPAGGRAALIAGGLMASCWLLAELFARLTAWRLRRSFERRERIMRRYQVLRWLEIAVLLGGYAVLIHWLDWPAVVADSWGLGDWVLVDDLLVLAPFLGGLVLSWLAQFRVEDCLRRRLTEPVAETRPWLSRWSHVEFLLRHQVGILLVPLLALVGLQDVIELVLRDSVLRAPAELAVGVSGFVGLILFAPLLLRLLWRARPLPHGALRRRLEELSRRLRFRSSDILVWHTRGAVINAAVAGLVPRLRYVLLSDGLLEHLSEEEIEAVFGHEVGHIRHHHLWFYVAFVQGASLILLASLTGSGMLLAQVMGQPAVDRLFSLAHGLAIPLGGVGVYFGVLFGLLSRRFERQADVFACRAVSCGRPDCPPHLPATGQPICRTALCPCGIATFTSALEKIARLNGCTREARSWRHFSIAKRVEFLERLAIQPELERRFQRVVVGMKLLVVATLLGSGWWLWQHAAELTQQFVRALP
jgi:STE24 endopeptidase